MPKLRSSRHSRPVARFLEQHASGSITEELLDIAASRNGTLRRNGWNYVRQLLEKDQVPPLLIFNEDFSAALQRDEKSKRTDLRKAAGDLRAAIQHAFESYRELDLDSFQP